MSGPGGAFGALALELLGGTFVALWLSSLIQRAVTRGHHRSVTWVLWPLMAGVALLLPAGSKGWVWGAALGMVIFLGAVYLQRPLLEWLAGGLASLASLGAIAEVGFRACECPAGAALSLAGAVFLGFLTHGMALGHWYLNQPRLPLEPLKLAVRLMSGALVLLVVAGLALRSRLVVGSVPGGPLAVTGQSLWWGWLVLMAGAGILARMIRTTVWTRSTQSATGLFYVAMVPAIMGQFLVNLLVSS